MPRTKAFNEEAVLEKALLLFWRQGFQGTSMQDLVDHLGINRASMYNSFGSKQDLFEKAFDTYRQRNMAQVKTFFESQSSVKEGLKTLLLNGSTETFKDGKVKGCMVVNCTSEFLPNNGSMLELLSANKDQFVQMLSDILQVGAERGEFADTLDTKAYATYIFTLYSGLNIVSKLVPPKEELETVIDQGLAGL